MAAPAARSAGRGERAPPGPVQMASRSLSRGLPVHSDGSTEAGGGGLLTMPVTVALDSGLYGRRLSRGRSTLVRHEPLPLPAAIPPTSGGGGTAGPPPAVLSAPGWAGGPSRLRLRRSASPRAWLRSEAGSRRGPGWGCPRSHQHGLPSGICGLHTLTLRRKTCCGELRLVQQVVCRSGMRPWGQREVT